MPPPRKLSPRRRDRRSRSHSPRRRRRSRSRSRSPKGRRRSRSPQRKRSPERRRRSLPRRRSPSPKKRSRSPKRRSRTHSPRRSRSRSPRRRIPSPKRSPPRRRSPSPVDRNYPIKRPADSSMKRHSFRSRSPSPTAVKRSRDERPRQDENPYEQQRPSKRSPSPLQETQYGGKMYADQPSSSSKQIFPAGSSKRREEIDFVTIVEKGQKKTKLHKRFETLEQVAQGPFDFEENITIGIHRGPQHIELDDDDDDVEVNYAFNTKTFKMLFSKKNYAKAIFDRKEILAFHLDDILDEEAYEEKRTISMKPIDKPRARKHDNDLDYKITVGSDGREGFGDRRMVHDSRSRPSRSGGYDDVPVTVRLDPKPDPRYEQLYREQQRYEEQPPMQDVVHRNPNDLRYNLMRRKSDGDRGDRGGRDPRDNRGDPVSQGMMDARSHIEARRQEIHPGEYPSRRERSGDRPGVHRASHRSQSPRGDGRKKAVTKTDLPDFKNRPDDAIRPAEDASRHHTRSSWGHCSVCNIPLYSEHEALQHVNGEQHRSNENARDRRDRNYSTERSRGAISPPRSERFEHVDRRESVPRLRSDEFVNRKRSRSRESDFDGRVVKRRSIGDDYASHGGDNYPRLDDFENLDGQYQGNLEGQYQGNLEGQYQGNRDARYMGDIDDLPPNLRDDGGTYSSTREFSKSRTRFVWIIGTEDMKELHSYASGQEHYGENFGLKRHNITLIWNCVSGLRLVDVLPIVHNMKIEEPKPHCILFHVGGNDLELMSKANFRGVAVDLIDNVGKLFPEAKVVWSQLLPRSRGLNPARVALDDEIATYVLEFGGHYIRYPAIELMDNKLFKMSNKGELHLTEEGLNKMMPVLKAGIDSILNRNISIIPMLSNLPNLVSFFVKQNMGKKFFRNPRERRNIRKKPYFMKKKKFQFFKRK